MITIKNAYFKEARHRDEIIYLRLEIEEGVVTIVNPGTIRSLFRHFGIKRVPMEIDDKWLQKRLVGKSTDQLKAIVTQETLAGVTRKRVELRLS